MNRKNQKKQMSLRVIAIAALTILLGLVIYFKIKPPIKPEQQLNVPIENQMPDLPNGCEVTSLAMLLNYYGINVTKEDLAQKIAHVSSYDGNYRGNPNKGFVGYMNTRSSVFITSRFLMLRKSILTAFKTPQVTVLSKLFN